MTSRLRAAALPLAVPSLRPRLRAAQAVELAAPDDDLLTARAHKTLRRPPARGRSRRRRVHRDAHGALAGGRQRHRRAPRPGGSVGGPAGHAAARRVSSWRGPARGTARTDSANISRVTRSGAPLPSAATTRKPSAPRLAKAARAVARSASEGRRSESVVNAS